MHKRAGQPAEVSDLVDIAQLRRAFYERVPDPSKPSECVIFGTSGHRGSSLRGSFHEAHIVAICLAIAEYRAQQGIQGPLFLGGDTHALSEPASRVAADTLARAGVRVLLSAGSGDEAYVPTPAISRAILAHNRGRAASDPDRADGIVVTPSHNPPEDGGIKYNLPHGGPAGGDATAQIAARANELLTTGQWRNCTPSTGDGAAAGSYDYLREYVDALETVIDMRAIREAGVRIGAHPLGGSSEAYWAAIRDRYELPITVLGSGVDPRWAFMHLDWDGKIRMDPSSPQVMATVDAYRGEYDLLVANDADADRHGIVTCDAGLMNPNHFLAVAIDYLLTHRPAWPSSAGIGKTLVSSSMIDRVVAAHGRTLVEVPVGFKWFVPGLADGTVVFGGEESAGASFVCRDGSPWSTDKDGIVLALLAAEIQAVTGQSPAARYAELARRFGAPAYARIDAPAEPAQKQTLASLTADTVSLTELAGDPVLGLHTRAAGNGEAIGGIKVQSEHAWFAIRPSGTEEVIKVYAESFRGREHLLRVQEEAQAFLRGFA